MENWKGAKALLLLKVRVCIIVVYLTLVVWLLVVPLLILMTWIRNKAVFIVFHVKHSSHVTE